MLINLQNSIHGQKQEKISLSMDIFRLSSAMSAMAATKFDPCHGEYVARARDASFLPKYYKQFSCLALFDLHFAHTKSESDYPKKYPFKKALRTYPQAYNVMRYCAQSAR